MAEYEARSEWSYPETSVTLFGKLREAQTGVDDAAWARFVDMYGPVVHHLVRLVSPWMQAADVDDAVQDVFIRLVSVLRDGMYDAGKAKFRTFLSTLVRRMLVDRYRAEKARRADSHVDVAEVIDVLSGGDDPGAVVDAKWGAACRKAAECRVLNESALPEQHREIWRLVADEGMKVKDVAKRLGIPANTVSKTKRRIEAMIAAMQKMYV